MDKTKTDPGSTGAPFAIDQSASRDRPPATSGVPGTGILRSADSLPALARTRMMRSTTSSTAHKAGNRCFIYARYSTDRQLEKSEERQFIGCREYNARARLSEKGAFSDRGLSGTRTAHRAQLQAMLAACRRREVDVVVVEDLDRLSRYLPDILLIYYELKSLGIALHDIRSGNLELVHIVIRGYMVEEGRVRFLALSKAGKANAIRNGRQMARVAMGYRRVIGETGAHIVDDDPQTQAGSIEAGIGPSAFWTAATVRWIFKVAANGMSAGAIARTLTDQGILPPAQVEPAREGVVAAPKAWQPNSVLKIIRNHLYLGLVTWETRVTLHDFETMDIVGHDVTDDKTWTIVELSHLRIVDNETWSQANLRLADLAYPAGARGTQFLLTGKVVCGSCGTQMKAIGSEYTTRYVCDGRRLRGAADCNGRGHHRVDWIEAAVIARVWSETCNGTAVERYQDAFRQWMTRSSKGDGKRRAALTRRLSEIDDLLLASFVKGMTHGLNEARMAKIRMTLEDEAERLDAELACLPRPADFTSRVGGLETLSGGIERMLAEVPFRPEDAEGIALANVFKDVVAEVAIHPSDAGGMTRLVITVDPLARLRASEAVSEDALPDPIALNTVVDTETLKSSEAGQRRRSLRDPLEAAAAAGRHDLTDAEWKMIAPIFVGVDLVFPEGEITPRLVLDGMLCFVKETGSMSSVPARFGDATVFRRAVRRVVYTRRWDEALATLRARSAGCVETGCFERYDTTEFPRQIVKAPPSGLAAESESARILTLAARQPVGDRIRLRLELVAMALDGRPIGASAEALGVTARAGYHYWTRYKSGGIAAIASEPKTRIRLSKAQIAQLRAIATAGVDPDAPDKPVTYTVLCRICKALFDASYSAAGMRILCRKNGFPLRPLVVRARRKLARCDDYLAVASSLRASPMDQKAVTSRTPASRKERRERAAQQTVATGSPVRAVGSQISDE